MIVNLQKANHSKKHQKILGEGKECSVAENVAK